MRRTNCRVLGRLLGMFAGLLLQPVAASPAQETEMPPMVIPASGIRLRPPPAPCPCPQVQPPCRPGMPPTPGAPPTPPTPGQSPSQQALSEAFAQAGEGGTMPSASFMPNVIGDLLNPDELIQFPATNNPALLAARAQRGPAQLPGFKIGENENVRPVDRVYSTFNYFNDVNGRVNQRLGAPIGEIDAQRELLGLEKTFLGGDASIGLRIPFNTLYITGVPADGMNGTFSSVGDISFILKRAVWENRPGGNFVSAGMMLTTPTGQTSYGGSGFLRIARDVFLQPFIGYAVPLERFYVQGFCSVAMPTNWGQDVVLMFNDVSFGYLLLRDREGDRFLTGLTPILEVHINTPFNHRGALSGPLGTPDSVVFTQGVTFEMRRRALLTLAVSEPITGFKPFDLEAAIQFNWRF